jgi:hypothetical protein
MTLLRTTLTGALSGTAQALSIASKLLDATAKSLRTSDGASDGARSPAPKPRPRPRPASEPVGTEAVIAEVAPDPTELGRVIEPPPTPLLDDTPHLRTSESHIEELAAQPAASVVKAVADLSTDELRLLTEHELAHKNRRTVLTAIEKALAPA